MQRLDSEGTTCGIKKVEFIPTLVPYRNSVAIPPQFLRGYFLRLEPRRSIANDAEVDIAVETRKTWLEFSGIPGRAGLISRSGGFLSLFLAEGSVKKLLKATPLSDVGFIEDDWMDGDLFETKEERNREERDGALRIAVNQIKAKCFVEILEGDEEANLYVKPYEDWISKHVESTGLLDFGGFPDLESYLEERLLTVGESVTVNLMKYCYQFKITDEQYKKSDLCRKAAFLIAILAADHYSAEVEWINHNKLEIPGEPITAVYLYMRWHDLTFSEAKDAMERMMQEKEAEFLRLREICWEELGRDPEVGVYLSALHLLISGITVWHLNHSRYDYDPEHPFAPKPEHKLNDLPRFHATESGNEGVTIDFVTSQLKDTSAIESEIITTDSISSKGSGPSVNGSTISSDAGTDETAPDASPWLAGYPKLSNQIVMEPCDYIVSMPSKKIRHVAIDALNVWYRVPPKTADVVKSVIDLLHNSSLILDDIEDGSPLRRGNPSTHMVFGTSQAINSANYMFVKSLGEVQKLGPSAVAIYQEELCNLHIGQALDLHWTFHRQCPSEREYMQMIDGKTGGLLRMAGRLMRDQAIKNRGLELEDLLNLVGRFFQIRDDYQNLRSTEYSTAKGDLSDLDEGKYSFMMIHALNHSKDKRLQSLIQLRSRQPEGKLSPEQKALIMKIMTRSKSLEYTENVLEELQSRIHEKLETIEAAGCEKNWVFRGIMARLAVADLKLQSF
ncbi:hypothetical protein TWF506_000707 [Arthrobotrys conoides]|uniref:Uncharacterized protein n=1 Tax=Arthrobotrys conoides TaxID=74498 RepID=A0AAN8NLH1_9PEZI